MATVISSFKYLLSLSYRFAQDRCAKLDMKKHHVLKSMHPSPLSAHRVSFAYHCVLLLTANSLRGLDLPCCAGSLRLHSKACSEVGSSRRDTTLSTCGQANVTAGRCLSDIQIVCNNIRKQQQTMGANSRTLTDFPSMLCFYVCRAFLAASTSRLPTSSCSNPSFRQLTGK